MLGWEVVPRIPIGNLSISPHGLGIAVGYFLGATLMVRRARRTGFDEDHAWNAAVVGVIGAIVGARLAYILGHSDQFERPIEYLQIYRGGISLMGGLIGGFLAAYLYCRRKNLDFGRLADLGAPGLAIGTAVGRIGDLVIGDHLGRPTEGFWGWEYQGGELISPPPCDPAVYPTPDGCIAPGMVVHQTALYDAIWALVIFVLLSMLDRKPRPKGFLVLTWAALYSAGRILTDFTRVDKTWFGTGLTGSQLTAVVVFFLSMIWLGRLRKAAPSAVPPATLSPATVPPAPGEEAQEPQPVAETAPSTGAPASAEPIGETSPVEQKTATPDEATEPAGTAAPEGDGEVAPVESSPPETEPPSKAAAEPEPAPASEPDPLFDASYDTDPALSEEPAEDAVAPAGAAGALAPTDPPAGPPEQTPAVRTVERPRDDQTP